MEDLIKQTEQGDAEAQFKLAMAYYRGNGAYSGAYPFRNPGLYSASKSAKIGSF